MIDYRDTVFLPKTDFPMRAGLPKKEPEIMARWDAIGMYERIMKERADAPAWILHDGPPYANGHIHAGTAGNKILKDIVLRIQTMRGFRCPYVPGWDCHGLPIEWKVEEAYRSEGKNKETLSIAKVRSDCREFAKNWLDIQRGEFKRLGGFGDWDNPYTTMTFENEARITAEIHKFACSGALYRGVKPILWSVVEGTALAEAETEYYDHKSPTIEVRFPVAAAACSKIEGADIVIWTTTPWTIPGNRALACGPDFAYGVYEVTEAGEDATAQKGDRLVLMTALAEGVRTRAKIVAWTKIADLTGEDLVGTVCRHPFAGQGYDFDVPVLSADFVTEDTGTGFVHIAPGHGADDYVLGMKNGIDVPETVGPDGLFLDDVPLFAGQAVLTDDGKDGPANGAVIKALFACKKLLAKGSLVHSYPHSWRSKAPLIFRATPQWFISMKGLRSNAMAAIDEIRFHPPQSRNRIRSMVENRPDWCISRQRAWGVPIAIFVHKKTRSILTDPAVLKRTVDLFRSDGADAWFTHEMTDFLGPDHDPNEYEKIDDIVDVWFESGSTHAFVLEGRDELCWPADLYLEGSDQHRGWFQSSLLESVGTRGTAPFKAVMTHGFVLDGAGRKMSKSLGNVIKPEKIVDKFGADILRMWIAGADYFDDIRISDDIIKGQVDAYRRLRNTLRYILGNLDGFTKAESLPVEQMPELERWVLHRLTEMNDMLAEGVETLSFHRFYAALHAFCATDLSAVYFDIRKDTLYCDRADSIRRRAARTVLDILFQTLVTWLAPVLCFTTEEAWLARYPETDSSVHLQAFTEISASLRDEKLAARWARLREIKKVVTGALEIARADKTIGSSLQAKPVLYLTDQADRALVDSVDLADLVITSDIEVVTGPGPEEAFFLTEVAGVAVVVAMAEGTKCARCWRILSEVGGRNDHPDLCLRCADATEHASEAAA